MNGFLYIFTATSARTRIQALMVVLMVNFSGTGSCINADLTCRLEDPTCSDLALIAWFTVSPSVPPVIWGDVTSNDLYQIRDSEEEPSALFNIGTPPRRLAFADDGVYLYINGGIGNELHRVLTEDGTTTLLNNGSSDVFSLVVVEDEGKIYLSDNGSGQINSVNLDGTNLSLVYAPANNMGMDIDEINQFQYVVNNNQIARFNMDGSGETIIIAGTGNIEDLEIDPDEQKLYWVDLTNGEVRSAGIDGSNEQLLYSGLSLPSGIAVHPSSSYLYICDTGTNEVLRMLRDGTMSVQIAASVDCLDIDFSPL